MSRTVNAKGSSRDRRLPDGVGGGPDEGGLRALLVPSITRSAAKRAGRGNTYVVRA
jgi:hypothetical protein